MVNNTKVLLVWGLLRLAPIMFLSLPVISDKSTFGKAILAGKASNLHVDIETEPSET